MGRAGRLAAWLAKAPVHLYRWTLKPLIGWECRHLPTCSDYALEAIDRNGAWRGFWLAVSRIGRCQPWGTSGYDPPPDIRGQRHPLAPWRYGRWTRRGLARASALPGKTTPSPTPPASSERQAPDT